VCNIVVDFSTQHCHATRGTDREPYATFRDSRHRDLNSSAHDDPLSHAPLKDQHRREL
jgi:hypothetical protein